MAARPSFITTPTLKGELPDLIERLDRAALAAAQQLSRAKDRSFARKSVDLPLQTQALRMALAMKKPARELVGLARTLLAAFEQLEALSCKSRLQLEERVAITIGRALAFQLVKRVADINSATSETPPAAFDG